MALRGTAPQTQGEGDSCFPRTRGCRPLLNLKEQRPGDCCFELAGEAGVAGIGYWPPETSQHAAVSVMLSLLCCSPLALRNERG